MGKETEPTVQIEDPSSEQGRRRQSCLVVGSRDIADGVKPR